VQITALTAPGGGPVWLAAAPDGTPLGTATLRLPAGPLAVHVHPAERRRGVGTRLLGAAAAAVREHGRPVVTEVVEAGSPGDRFFAARGLRQVLALTYTRLDLTAAAVEPDPRPGYHLVAWQGTVPDHLAASFAASRRAMDDMPMDDAAVEREVWDVDRVRAVAGAVQARGEHLLTVAAVDAAGEIAGFTELVVPAGGTGDGMNYGTGVLPAHRGHGLAGWMKAESVRLVRERFPQLAGLIADTADSNAAMREVNRRLGYVPTHRSLMYQLDPGASDGQA
jgi:GNAT superfamily N-acetyltransferase